MQTASRPPTRCLRMKRALRASDGGVEFSCVFFHMHWRTKHSHALRFGVSGHRGQFGILWRGLRARLIASLHMRPLALAEPKL